jgi:hypothetical protein
LLSQIRFPQASPSRSWEPTPIINQAGPVLATLARFAQCVLIQVSHQRLACPVPSLRYSGCPEIADFDGSRGVPPDAIKPLVSTHLELMSLDYSVIGARNY